MPRKLKGVRRHHGKRLAYVDVVVDGKPKQLSKTFPLDALDQTIVKWRNETKDQYASQAAGAGSFAADVQAYLEKPKIAAQSRVKEKKTLLAFWLAALGRDRPRASITQDDIEAVLQDWLTRLASPTVYHRRSVLLSLYVTLDGPGAKNPVLGTTCPKAWIPRDQSVPFATLTQIVAAMADDRYITKGIRQPSLGKLRTAVLLHTGMRPVDLTKIRRTDLEWQAGLVRMPATKKGKGGATWTLPLTAEGLAAFRAFDVANAYGFFVVNALSQSFKRAVRRVAGDAPIHLYSLRHSVGADLYRTTGDLATVGRLLGHAVGSHVTPQYARGANADVDRAAILKLSAARAVPTLTKSLTKTAKSFKRVALRRVS